MGSNPTQGSSRAVLGVVDLLPLLATSLCCLTHVCQELFNKIGSEVSPFYIHIHGFSTSHTEHKCVDMSISMLMIIIIKQKLVTSVNDHSFIFQYQGLLEEATREKEHLTIEIEYVVFNQSYPY